jgi:protein-disulfide isomerase
MLKILKNIWLVLLVFAMSGCIAQDSSKGNSMNESAAMSDENIIKFEKKRISLTTSLDVKNISIFHRQKLEVGGWNVYVLSLDLKNEQKEFETKDILFSDGKTITTELFDPKTSRSYKDKIEVKLPDSIYDDTHLIAGNKDAKHKAVLFSDPLCPYCIEYVPKLIDFVKNNPDTVALYYYHFPLVNIHPTSMIISQGMIKLHMQGKIDSIETKTYRANFDSTEQNSQKVLDTFNKALNTTLTMQDINEKQVVDMLQNDMKIASDSLISGTPTIYIDGKLDKTRELYKTLK